MWDGAQDPEPSLTLLSPVPSASGGGFWGGGTLFQGAEPLITSLPESITAPPGAAEMEKLLGGGGNQSGLNTSGSGAAMGGLEGGA